MNRLFVRVLSIFLSILFITGTMWSSAIGVFAEENTEKDIWDGTRNDFIEKDGDTYFIKSAKDFAWFSAQVNAGNTFFGKTVELKINIDLSNQLWTPIGKNLTCAFSGTFKGNNHSIFNLNVGNNIDSGNIINAPYHSAGLFGVCINANVSGIKLYNSKVSIKNTSGYSNAQSSIDGTSIFAGEVCGYAKNSKFLDVETEDSTVYANAGSEAGAVCSGGFFGYMSDGCEAAYCFKIGGSTSGTTQSLTQNVYTGGIVGKLANENTIRQCCNYGNLISESSVSSAYTGGVVGYSENHAEMLSVIKDCFNQGVITHNGSWLDTGAIGGIIGYSFSTVNRCYNSGDINVNSNTVAGNLFASGIAGDSNSNATISNCASFPTKISGGTQNFVVSANGKKENNVAYSSINGVSFDNSTQKMSLASFSNSSVYVTLGWDFSSIWEFGSGNYPILQEMDTEDEQEIAAVNSAINSLLIQFDDGDNYNKVTKDIVLLKEINGLSVNWVSSDESIINSETGKVYRSEQSKQIRLTASISRSEKYVCTKKFVLCVIGTQNSENVQSEDWGISVDDARELIAMVRKCKFKDIPSNDPDVIVLIGQDTDEEHIIETMTKLIAFWEVPVDNAYLRTKVGDVIGLIKSGSDQAINELLSSVSGGLIHYNSEKSNAQKSKLTRNSGTAEIDGKTVAKKLMAIPEAMLDIKFNIIEAYEKVKLLGEIKFDSNSDIMIQSLNNCKKVGDFVDYTVNKAGTISGEKNPIKLGKVLGYVSKGVEGLKLFGAFKDAKQNAVKAYLKQYLDIRGDYESADDETFKLIMTAFEVTSIKTDVDKIQEVAECLFFLNSKFCAGLQDEYKIQIACPVDIEVYNENYDLVGRVVNNIVDYSINNSVRISISGDNKDIKNIFIQDKEEYSIKINGNDQGTMNVSIIGNEQGYQECYSYNNILVFENKNMIMDFSGNDNQQKNIPKIETLIDGAIYFASETKEVDDEQKLYNFCSFECLERSGEIEISQSGGIVGDGQIVAGTLLTDLITTKSGYSFEGFYSDAQCKNRYSELRMPQRPISLYAKFIKNDSRVNFTKQPKNSSYMADEKADALEIDFECDDYETSVQWYMKDYLSDDIPDSLIDGAIGNSYLPKTTDCGTIGYYAVISVKDEDGMVIATVKSNIAIITVNEHQLVANGVCGENLQWSFYDNNKLKFFGSGEMSEYLSLNDVPWKNYSKKVESVIIPETMTSISSFAFSNCELIKSIVIPDSILSIGEYALENCNSLEEISVPFIGKNRESNNDYASVLGHIFGRCKTDEDGIAQYYKSNNNELFGYKYKIPKSLKKVIVTDADKIPFGTFYGCSSLSEVVLNDGITNINEFAFCDCTSLNKINIPNSVNSISENILKGCTSIESVSLPFVGSSRTASNDYDSVFGYVFGRCENTKGTKQYYAENGTSLYSYNYDIPLSLKEISITDADYIPFGAFHNCLNVVNFNINKVSSLGGYSFANCMGIKEFYIPDSVISIGEYTFSGCDNLESLQIPFVGSSRDANETYDAAFGYIFGRASSGTIQYCIVSGDSISGYCYAIPSGLKNVTVTDATTIPVGAFSNCKNINTLKLNEGIETISAYSLMGCIGLKEISLPFSLQKLTYDDLSECSDLDKIYIYSKECIIDNGAIPENAIIYAYLNSTAHDYSKNFNRNFIPIDVSISSNNLIIDRINKMIFGIMPSMKNVGKSIIVSGAGSAEITANGKAVTGTEVILKDVVGNITEKYYLVLFGDVNGDGLYDGRDAVTVSMIANGMLTREQVGEAVWMAADCNHDGKIDQADVDLLNQAGLLLSSVDQTKSTEELLETSSEYNEYINLIDQSVEVKSDEPEQESPETQKPSLLEFLLTTIWNYIKLILSLFK